ncbi:hypothetical protein [Chryseobacterium sp. 3008163]|nr:hypothetical protein [Chryseobacterium sp. 3008163]
MKNTIIIAFLTLCTSCEGKKQTNESIQNSSPEIEKSSLWVTKPIP